MAAEDRRRHPRVAAGPGGARARRGQAAQSRADVLRAEQAAAGEGNLHRRFGLDRVLVRALPRHAQGNDGVFERQSRDHGPQHAVRGGGQVRLSGSAGVRARRRRRDADERHERPDHRRQVLEGMEGPALRRAGAQQPRPEHGDVGAARAGGRAEVRRVAGDSGLSLRVVCGVDRADGAAV